MAKGARKFTGFLWAMLIAIVSFFIIYIFFPDVSLKFFGVCMDKDKAAAAVTQAVDEFSDAAIDKAGEILN